MKEGKLGGLTECKEGFSLGFLPPSYVNYVIMKEHINYVIIYTESECFAM